jgi:hypothetical protein
MNPHGSDEISNKLDAFMNRVPVWVPRLEKGTLFGKRKDELILEILYLGGMSLIESRCGLRFTNESDCPNCEPTMKALLAIKRELQEQQTMSISTVVDNQHYDSAREVLIDKEGLSCVMTVLTPKPK